MHSARDRGRRLLFGVCFVAILLAVTLALLEAAAYFLVPPWPQRVLRPMALETRDAPPESVEAVLDPAFRWGSYQMNSWGMHDFERSLTKPPGSRRILLVGDSFVDGAFARVPLPPLVQARIHERGERGIEIVNLGVSATGLWHYYFRLHELAPTLTPDAVFLFVYSGNDYLSPKRNFRGRYTHPIHKLVEELPRPSVLGSLTPRFAWLLVSRLRLSSHGRGNAGIPDESQQLARYVAMPFEQGIERITDHVQRYYQPDVPRDRLREILGRGGPRFWEAIQDRGPDSERLAGWILNNMVDGEVRPPRVLDPDEVRGRVDASLSWIEATQRLCDASGIPLVVFVIPVGIVDPVYMRFWEPWPGIVRWNQWCEMQHRGFVDALARTPIRFVDLADDLDGVESTYRLIDGHWTTRGTELASEAVLREIARLARSDSF